MAASCRPSYQGLRNRLGQSPCEVADRVASVCAPYSLAPLDSFRDETHYAPPAAANDPLFAPSDTTSSLAGSIATPCLCNVQVYNLACAACQQNSPMRPSAYDFWILNCRTNTTNFPYVVPGDTVIPRWASNILETSAMIGLALNTPSAIISFADGPVATTTMTVTDTLLVPTNSSPPLGAPSPNLAGPIAGAVVGFFTLLSSVLLLRLFLRRRRTSHTNGERLYDLPSEKDRSRSTTYGETRTNSISSFGRSIHHDPSTLNQSDLSSFLPSTRWSSESDSSSLQEERHSPFLDPPFRRATEESRLSNWRNLVHLAPRSSTYEPVRVTSSKVASFESLLFSGRREGDSVASTTGAVYAYQKSERGSFSIASGSRSWRAKESEGESEPEDGGAG